MKIQEFLEIIETHKDTSLLFEYAPNQLVGANYHITEVKHTQIDSVDCGARSDKWNETIIQLWESPSELGKTEYMTSHKALAILKRVGKMRAYDLSSEVKFEYGNQLFHTAQMFVNDYELRNNQLLIKLGVEKTDCKAKDECGVPEPELVEQTQNSCAPGSGCC